MAQKSTDLIFENRFICQTEVKQGAFGIVYQGFDLIEKRPLAIKLEKDKKSHTTSSLTNEARILSKLKGVKGIPTLYWSGKKAGSEERALAMTFLGKDLQYYLTKFKTFSLKCVLMCGIQLLKVLQQVHDRGIVHRDIKPDNILTCYDEDDQPMKLKGLIQEKDLNQLYICDFGISKIYKENNKHIDYKINKPFIGTIRFASEAAHKGYEVSRKDDIESLGYVLVFLLKGKLPWQNIDKALGNLRKDRVGVCKQLENLLEYFYDLPDEFIQFFKYVKGLTFKENPNYDYIIGLFASLAKKKNIVVDDLQWDWKKKTIIKNAYFPPSQQVSNKVYKVEESKENQELLSKINYPKKQKTPQISACIKKKTMSDSDEKSLKNIKEQILIIPNAMPSKMPSKPKINIKRHCDYNSDEEGKRNRHHKMIHFKDHPNQQRLLAHEVDSHDKEVYFNSKSLISSNIETNESSVLIKNKDFTTLKFNVFDQEENGIIIFNF